MAIDNHFLTPEAVWEHYRAEIEQLANLSGSSIFVREAHRGGCLFLSPRFATLLDYDVPEGSRSSDGRFLERSIWAEDLTEFDNVIERLYSDYIYSLPREEQKNYKHIFEFRAHARGGRPVRMISQHQVLDHTADGRVLLLGAVDLSPDQSMDTGLKFTLVNFKTNEIVPFAVRENSEGSLTRREKEILECIQRGMYSKEISDRLSISIHTVNRHRQNILEKLGADNAREAIAFARKRGFLS